LWPTLVGYATRLVGDRALAEDCAQDALIQLFGQLDRYDRERDALTWALTLTTWQCRTARRRQARRSALSSRHDARSGATGASPAGSFPGGSSLGGSSLGGSASGGSSLEGGASLGGPDGSSFDGRALVEHRDLVRAALAALDDLGARDIETLAIAITDADRTATLAPATFRKRLERALSRLRTSWRSRHGTL
ncbi:MAG TPA: sigma factor, partial [Kofleriaceae bacterium]|nr:sigma factor [Kofleriaceae bacterium]